MLYSGRQTLLSYMLGGTLANSERSFSTSANKKKCFFLFSILQHKAHGSFDTFALVPLPLMFFFINQRAQPQKRSRVTFEFIMLRGIRGFNTF